MLTDADLAAAPFRPYALMEERNAAGEELLQPGDAVYGARYFSKARRESKSGFILDVRAQMLVPQEVYEERLLNDDPGTHPGDAAYAAEYFDRAVKAQGLTI